jgi:hypothetical protein
LARFGTIRHGQSMKTESFHECFLSRHSVPPKFIGGNRDVFLPLRDAVLLQWGHRHSSVHIDRLGQKYSPIIRYLIVNTKQGLLQGDKEIFDRLVQKVEEINQLLQSGESVLQLYDPKTEEEYVAKQGILKGNVDILEKKSVNYEPDILESIINDASKEADEDFLNFLLGESSDTQQSSLSENSDIENRQRLRLFTDKKFLLDGYRFLCETNSNYQPIQEHSGMMVLPAPKDLKRRLGASDERGDIIYGSTAIPEEAWSEDDYCQLFDDPDRVEISIKAARQTSGYWSREQLCTDQHPILQWITERLVMQINRGEAPYILSQGLKKDELCFCFIGQVSSNAGIPLVVDAHTISYHKGGKCVHRPLHEALNIARFDRLVNTGERPNLKAAQLLVNAAVKDSLKHLRNLQKDHEHKMIPLYRKETRRLKKWSDRRKDILENKIDEISSEHPRAKRYKKELEEMKDYINDREKIGRKHIFYLWIIQPLN